MACSGPNEYLSNQRAEEIYADVVLYLKEKHGIHGANSFFPAINNDFEAEFSKLRDCIKALKWTQDCADF